MNEMNFYTLNGEQYEVADKKARENNALTNEALKMKSDISYVNQAFAPAIPVTMTGKAVSTNMVSPLKHQVKCCIYSNNLLSGLKNLSGGNESPWRVSKNYVKLKKGVAYFVKLDRDGLPDVQYSFFFRKAISGEIINAEVVLVDHFTVKCTPREDYDQVEVRVHSLSGIDPNSIKIQMNASSLLPYSPYAANLEAVKVSKYGKNLQPGKVIKHTEDWKKCTPINLVKDVVYIVKYYTIIPDGRAPEVFKFRDKQGVWIDDNYIKIDNHTFSIKPIKDYSNAQIWFYKLETDANNMLIMVAVDELSEYSPYVLPDQYNPRHDGVVSGMTSLESGMTIITDNPDVNIEAAYNADIKNYIDRNFKTLQAAILSTGGNV